MRSEKIFENTWTSFCIAKMKNGIELILKPGSQSANTMSRISPKCRRNSLQSVRSHGNGSRNCQIAIGRQLIHTNMARSAREKCSHAGWHTITCTSANWWSFDEQGLKISLSLIQLNTRVIGRMPQKLSLLTMTVWKPYNQQRQE